MASMSNYLESMVIQHVFRTSSYTKPSTLAIALCTAAPSDTDTGALTSKEVANSNAYARQTLNPSDSNWNNVSSGNGTTSNISAITFPSSTGAWGTITHIAITDNSTHGAGNLLFWGTMASPKVISASGAVLSFSAGQLTCQIDD